MYYATVISAIVSVVTTIRQSLVYSIAEYIKQHPKKGIPNPFIKELWKDENHYLRVNEANPKRLSRGQVIRIRKLHALGKTIPEITKEVNALNQRQVKGVIEGKNYYRIH